MSFGILRHLLTHAAGNFLAEFGYEVIACSGVWAGGQCCLCAGYLKGLRGFQPLGMPQHPLQVSSR